MRQRLLNIFKPEGWVRLATVIALAGVVIHLGAILGGPAWFAFFGAPPLVVASAKQGSWLAPVSSLLIAGLMGTCAWYAASALAWVPRPPLQRLGLSIMASICILRALLLPVLAIGHPELRNTFEVIAAVVWLLAGFGFALAVYIMRRTA